MVFIILQSLIHLMLLIPGNPMAATPDRPLVMDDLVLLEFVICKDVIEREPVDIVQSYSMEDERAWSFARISNPGKMRSFTFVWYYNDDVFYEFETKIGRSPNWRTYSSVALQPGVWKVELHNEDGEKMNEVRFHVSE
ncbi:MAG: DUF2914 domain-containing protein [Balneolales bacterium]